MASGRDDFIIAIRSAFLKKSTKQKFSLLTLTFISLFVLILSSLDFKVVRYLKIGINEFVYRSSFLVSIPENFIKTTFFGIIEYSTFYNEYSNNKNELLKLQSNNVSSKIIQFENDELKNLINDYVSSSDKILAKIIVDHDSPFLKSIIINKGSKDKITIGTNIYDETYLVGRVIEVNYTTSRVLLLSDLNSNVPVTIAPQNIQAIITGSGENYGQIKYIQKGVFDDFNEQSIVYTSGTGAVFKSGIPIGKLKVVSDKSSKKFNVDFYSDFTQLKYVFAEIYSKTDVLNLDKNKNRNKKKNSLEAKLQILENKLKIVEDINLKFKEENKILKDEINNLNIRTFDFKNKISSLKNEINQFNIDTQEIEYLRLNLVYGHKCRKSFTNPKGFKVGGIEYKNCVLNKGIKNE